MEDVYETMRKVIKLATYNKIQDKSSARMEEEGLLKDCEKDISLVLKVYDFIAIFIDSGGNELYEQTRKMNPGFCPIETYVVVICNYVEHILQSIEHSENNCSSLKEIKDNDNNCKDGINAEKTRTKPFRSVQPKSVINDGIAEHLVLDSQSHVKMDTWNENDIELNKYNVQAEKATMSTHEDVQNNMAVDEMKSKMVCDDESSTYTLNNLSPDAMGAEKEMRSEDDNINNIPGMMQSILTSATDYVDGSITAMADMKYDSSKQQIYDGIGTNSNKTTGYEYICVTQSDDVPTNLNETYVSEALEATSYAESSITKPMVYVVSDNERSVDDQPISSPSKEVDEAIYKGSPETIGTYTNSSENVCNDVTTEKSNVISKPAQDEEVESIITTNSNEELQVGDYVTSELSVNGYPPGEKGKRGVNNVCDSINFDSDNDSLLSDYSECSDFHKFNGIESTVSSEDSDNSLGLHSMFDNPNDKKRESWKSKEHILAQRTIDRTRTSQSNDETINLRNNTGQSGIRHKLRNFGFNIRGSMFKVIMAMLVIFCMITGQKIDGQSDKIKIEKGQIEWSSDRTNLICNLNRKYQFDTGQRPFGNWPDEIKDKMSGFSLPGVTLHLLSVLFVGYLGFLEYTGMSNMEPPTKRDKIMMSLATHKSHKVEIDPWSAMMLAGYE